MITESGARLGLICVIILIQSCLADPNLPKMRLLQSVLDEDSVELTWEMVEEAAQEFSTENNPNFRDSRDTDAINLLRDAFIHPFAKHADEIDEEEQGAFLRECLLTYKLFWPVYVAKKKLPGGSISTPLCKSFYEGLLGEKTDEQLTKEDYEAVGGGKIDKRLKKGDFFAAVGEIQVIVNKATEINKAGQLPYKYNELIEIYNTVLENQLILDTEELLSLTVGRQQKIPIDYIIEIYNGQVEREKRRKAEEDEEWKALVKDRQKQSLAAAKALSRLDGKDKGKQGADDGSGPSG